MRCAGCFEEKNVSQICPACGYAEGKEGSSLLLPHGTLLRGQYCIGTILGVPGGFGVTYLGYNQTLQTKVAIKEYFPKEVVGRDKDSCTVVVRSAQEEDLFKTGMDQFLNEARLLAKFSHPNIIRVLDFFAENGTAYLVMEYHQGINLVEYISAHGGSLEEDRIRKIMLPILDGLQEVHAHGVLHRDIKPQNIYITEKNTAILLDFGAARYVSEDTKGILSVIMTPKFSPYEQYHKQGKQGPWTDVYGFAATIYYMFTGEPPQDVLVRMENDSFSLSAEVAKKMSVEMRYIVTKGMALQPGDRFQSIEEMQRGFNDETIRLVNEQIPKTMILSEEGTIRSGRADLGQQEATQKSKTGREFKHSIRIFIVILLLAISGVSGYLYYQHIHNPISLLATHGISYTEDGFFNVVKIGNLEAVALFLEAGMNVNQVHKDTGETPVMIAIEANQSAVVNFLISKGADLTLQDQQGANSLEVAIKQGNIPLIKQVMDQLQVTVTTKDVKGKGLLDKAMATGNLATVKFFIEQGADINAQDEQGNTPLDRMLASSNQPMVTLLKSAGAKRNINKKFTVGQLNEVLPSYAQRGFEMDLLDDGIGQKLTINKGDFFHSSVAVISQQERQLATTKIADSNCTWYIAYLRNDKIPDLIGIHITETGGFINEFKIIGKTGRDTIDVLFDGKADFGWGFGGGARLAIDGDRLVIYSKNHQAQIEWEDPYFRVSKQF